MSFHKGQRVIFSEDGATGQIVEVHPSGRVEVEWDDMPGEYDFFEPETAAALIKSA